MATADAIPWYHTIELPGGVVTPGRWDTRASAAKLPIPSALAGARCLDIGTWDGFWAFEMERRGADEVVAIDLQDMSQWDWPGNAPAKVKAEWVAGADDFPGYRVAHEALGSRVERREMSVYDLDPAAIGLFDFIFMGSLLPHLRDPVRALGAVRSVMKDGGTFLSADVFSISMTLLHPFRPAANLHGDRNPAWWTPNIQCRKRWVKSAGFEIEKVGAPYFVARGVGAPRPRRQLRARVMAHLGLHHLWILARATAQESTA
ncbi:MAG: tRNA (mo5U34)-methyltransferase [Gaiellaceae bacterium]|jgi:tRNA (mo5U34)-methyltransferase|nr:tRNA (mo5U34)-methyltransferase [Gaiellaceae bacterium]